MVRVIKKFLTIFNKKQKLRIIIITIMMIIGAFLEMLGVSLILPLISSIMEPDIINSNTYVKMICNIFDLHSNRTFMILVIVTLMFVFIFKGAFLILQNYIQYRFVYNTRFLTQQRILESYLHRPYEYFMKISTGEIIRVVQTDTLNAFLLLTVILGFCTDMVVVFALGLTILIMDPLITIFVGIVMLILILVITKMIKPLLSQAGKSVQLNAGLVNKWILQSVNGIKELKVSRKEEFFEGKFEQYGRYMINAEKRSMVFNSIPRLLIEAVSMCSMLALIAILIYIGRDLGTMVPALSAFAMAAIKLLPSANRIVGALGNVSYYEPALDKVLESLQDAENEPYLAKTGKVESMERSSFKLQKKISLKNITYHYPDTTTNVLADASVDIEAGTSVGLIGVSGAGKTTVVDILLGLLKPQEGKVYVDGIDIQLNYKEWLSQIGYIPQMIFMMDDSIKANVAFGLTCTEIDEIKVWKALEDAQLSDFVKGLPDGIETQIGERGVRLSGGQRQRIGIARALYSEPELLIFDEATSALDNETELGIMESINSLHGKKTMVIIAHRLQTIKDCDVVYRVSDGKIFSEDILLDEL